MFLGLQGDKGMIGFENDAGFHVQVLSPSLRSQMRRNADAAITDGNGFLSKHHSFVRTHSAAGERVLFVKASFTSRIDGLDKPEGRRLLAHPSRADQGVGAPGPFRLSLNAVAIRDNHHTALPRRRILIRMQPDGTRHDPRRSPGLTGEKVTRATGPIFAPPTWRRS